jgi:hypothetical protein
MRRLGIIVLGLVFGCGGGGSGGVPLDNLGIALGEASCEKTFECCNATEIMEEFDGVEVNGQPITTEAQCEAFVGGLATGFLVPGLKASVEAGRAEYDGDAAAACMAVLREASCSTFSMEDAIVLEGTGCEQFIIPKVAQGGACTQDYECTTDNCVGATTEPGGASTDGACQPKNTAGQTCMFDSCADGLFCGFDPNTSMSTCQALKADGMTCSGDDECTSDNCEGTCMTPPPRCDGN